MKKQKPLSTIAGLSISAIGIPFELWTAQAFSWGGHAAFIVYAVPLGIVLGCFYLIYLFSRRYLRNQPTSILALVALTIFASAGWVFNFGLLLYAFNSMNFNAP